MRSGRIKLFLSMIVDAVLTDVALLLSLLLCGYFSATVHSASLVYHLGALPVVVVVMAYLLRTYHILWRFAGFLEYSRMAAVSLIASGIYLVLFRTTSGVPSVQNIELLILILFLLLTVFLTAARFGRHLLELRSAENLPATDKGSVFAGNIMVIGAGSAGSQFVRELNGSNRRKSGTVRCVIDDDAEKWGQYLNGACVVGGREAILDAVGKYQIDRIVFAIPTCPNEQKAAIMHICQLTKCRLYTVPPILQLLEQGEESVSDTVREVQIEDLLGRDAVKINVDEVMGYVTDRVILVTGGGGSIGSELCRQLASHSPKQLIIFDVYENSAYEIENELKHSFPNLNLVTLIGSVRDSKRLEYLFSNYRPEIVYHAAAHKHVPLMENSPNEAIKNNVFGTYKTGLAAAKFGVKKFVLISTDKAVNPTNIMGASKRICEMVVQSFNRRFDTEFVAVRFGNVLGSNGSVIPLFKRQIAEGGPVTVTHPDIIRYFMTIPEAVSLVIQAGASAVGGEIFVLDMGKPVRILELAENLIRLSGLEPYKDISITFTGLRPGEKLYEEMLMSEEGLQSTDNRLIFIGRPIEIDEDFLAETLGELERAMYDESIDIRAVVQKLVPSYTYSALPNKQ